MEILNSPDFDDQKIFELEMHSFLNVLNVITTMSQLMQYDTVNPKPLKDLQDRAMSMARAIQSGNRDVCTADNILQLKVTILSSLQIVSETDPEYSKTTEFAEYDQIFRDVLSVLDVRVSELQLRTEHPDKWEFFSIDTFKYDFRKFFYAMEQSSRGRYRIVYNVAQQEEIDYLVHFEVSSDLSDRVAMPILLKDVIRDLIANARKHTPPGGDITIGLALENKRLRFIVIFRLYSGPRFTNLYA